MDIRLSDWNEDWVRMFEEESRFLKTVFGDLIISFEHFGSTSVKGLKAKPVIDMMAIVVEIEKVDSFNEKMAELGYDVAGEWGIAGRRLFRKGGENRTHHIHFYQFDNPQIERHLIFRDYLRIHPSEAENYAAFKVELAKRFKRTSGYSPAKKSFVQEMDNRAFQWHLEKEKRKLGNGNP